MSDKPLVSVCIQTFQHALYIEQCLQSVLSQQTTFPFEIILGEDESTDGTREICQRLKNDFPDKINLFLRKEKDKIWIDGEKTGRYNFIHNLKAAKGKYIALLDGDDYWIDQSKLQKQVEFLEKNPSHTVCFCNFKMLKNRKFSTVFYMRLRRKNYLIGTIPHMHTGSVVFRNPGFEIIPEHLWQTFFLDFPLYMYVTGTGKIRRMSKHMAVYRLHDKGIWTGKSKELKCQRAIKVYKLMLPYYTGGAKKLLYKKLEKDIKYLLSSYTREKNGIQGQELLRLVETDDFLKHRKGLKKYTNRILHGSAG